MIEYLLIYMIFISLLFCLLNFILSTIIFLYYKRQVKKISQINYNLTELIYDKCVSDYRILRIEFDLKHTIKEYQNIIRNMATECTENINK